MKKGKEIIDFGFGLKTTLSFQNEAADYVSGAGNVLQKIDYSQPFKIEFLYGDDWQEFSIYKRQVIGRIIAIMARTGKLPLEFTGSPKTKPRRYIVKPS